LPDHFETPCEYPSYDLSDVAHNQGNSIQSTAHNILITRSRKRGGYEQWTDVHHWQQAFQSTGRVTSRPEGSVEEAQESWCTNIRLHILRRTLNDKTEFEL
jgi:hypothetical protein